MALTPSVWHYVTSAEVNVSVGTPVIKASVSDEYLCIQLRRSGEATASIYFRAVGVCGSFGLGLVPVQVSVSTAQMRSSGSAFYSYDDVNPFNSRDLQVGNFVLLSSFDTVGVAVSRSGCAIAIYSGLTPRGMCLYQGEGRNTPNGGVSGRGCVLRICDSGPISELTSRGF